uniref:Beta-hexosaminidase n=1 Tax=Trichobilharzia regenti TaxID=157069 RepID=A0AA85K8P9_TRIRE|nr:unnamed protein product [Trichobilharzia regenti]
MITAVHLISCILLIVSQHTVNSLVPRPLKYKMGESLCSLAELLSAEHNYPSCYILKEALKVFNKRFLVRQLQKPNVEGVSCSINTLNIVIKEGCDETENKLWPSEYMDESYTISIMDERIDIESNEVWGTLHALQTIIQLVHRSKWGALVINEYSIEDSPRFIHRGFLVDTARHYISVDEIEKFIDAMAIVKMNVFHWHMTDDSSFPYVSSSYPQLSLKGAYNPQIYVYENTDVVRVIEYARLRGIRVMVEFDTPSHTKSWENGYPGVRTNCYNGDELDGETGPFNPANETTFEFLKEFYREITSIFLEGYIHLGGNDVSYSCWQSNPEVLNFMNVMNFGDDFGKLESYYFDHLTEVIQSVQPEGYAVTPVVWQDVYENGYRPSNATVIHVRKAEDWPQLVKSITSDGYRVILSSCWQINNANFSGDWYDYYECDPGAFEGTEDEQQLVVGGEAILFGEYVDESNLFTRSWPDGAVVAERLWSQGEFDVYELKPRLTELRCHMRDFGMNPQPVNEPTNCLQP